MRKNAKASKAPPMMVDGKNASSLLSAKAQAYNLSRRLLKVSLHGGGERSRGRLLKVKCH